MKHLKKQQFYEYTTKKAMAPPHKLGRQKGEAWKKRYVQSVAESIWLIENGKNIVARDVRKKETGSGIGKGDK